ncbi:hypothetical protein ALC152_08680 [Arcobacter sp. 15-2]|uniref:peptidoglycan editing factor PgeF n=1 Tax=Arcobacter sp. 15-2 TaxID=3374109 RepID=UPI00399CA8DB
MLKVFTTIEDKNLAFHVTDDIDSVKLARKALAKKYKFDHTTLHSMDQIHSNIVKNISMQSPIQTCDAIITDQPNTPLMVLVADCIPILFFDETINVIAVAHAGRVGTFNNIASNTIRKMVDNYNCDVTNIQVVLGPSIQKCCYEVSEEMAQEVLNKFGAKFLDNRNIDLQAINKHQLLKIGVLSSNIEISSICTKCSNHPYFSYRKNKSCGRFAGLIMID